MDVEEVVMLGSLVVLSCVDLRERKIPLIPTLILGVGFLMYRLWNGVPLAEVAAGVIPGGILLLVSLVTEESIGYGDGLVLLILGVLCGVMEAVAVLGMALLLAAVLSIVLLVLRRVGRKTKLPFLPCLCSGYLLFLLW